MEQNLNPTNSTSAPTEAPEEGSLTKTVEQYTAQIPSLGYLGMAAGSLVASIAIAAFTDKKTLANFVGLWVPSFLILGLYNKLVKLEGSDSRSQDPQRLH